MNFIIDFLKAIFIERDKEKTKNSIIYIAIIIIAGWLVGFYVDVTNTLKENTDTIARLKNYKITVIYVTDSMMEKKNAKIIAITDIKIDNVIKLIHDIDDKRRQEIDYLAKYKNKSYQEIMDVLRINDERWEFEISKDNVMKSYKSIEPIYTPIMDNKSMDTSIIYPISNIMSSMPEPDSSTYDTIKNRKFIGRLVDNIFK